MLPLLGLAVAAFFRSTIIGSNFELHQSEVSINRFIDKPSTDVATATVAPTASQPVSAAPPPASTVSPPPVLESTASPQVSTPPPPLGLVETEAAEAAAAKKKTTTPLKSPEDSSKLVEKSLPGLIESEAKLGEPKNPTLTKLVEPTKPVGTVTDAPKPISVVEPVTKSTSVEPPKVEPAVSTEAPKPVPEAKEPPPLPPAATNPGDSPSVAAFRRCASQYGRGNELFYRKFGDPKTVKKRLIYHVGGAKYLYTRLLYQIRYHTFFREHPTMKKRWMKLKEVVRSRSRTRSDSNVNGGQEKSFPIEGPVMDYIRPFIQEYDANTIDRITTNKLAGQVAMETSSSGATPTRYRQGVNTALSEAGGMESKLDQLSDDLSEEYDYFVSLDRLDPVVAEMDRANSPASAYKDKVALFEIDLDKVPWLKPKAGGYSPEKLHYILDQRFENLIDRKAGATYRLASMNFVMTYMMVAECFPKQVQWITRADDDSWVNILVWLKRLVDSEDYLRRVDRAPGGGFRAGAMSKGFGEIRAYSTEERDKADVLPVSNAVKRERVKRGGSTRVLQSDQSSKPLPPSVFGHFQCSTLCGGQSFTFSRALLNEIFQDRICLWSRYILRRDGSDNRHNGRPGSLRTLFLRLLGISSEPEEDTGPYNLQHFEDAYISSLLANAGDFYKVDACEHIEPQRSVNYRENVLALHSESEPDGNYRWIDSRQEDIVSTTLYNAVLGRIQREFESKSKAGERGTGVKSGNSSYIAPSRMLAPSIPRGSSASKKKSFVYSRSPAEFNRNINPLPSEKYGGSQQKATVVNTGGPRGIGRADQSSVEDLLTWIQFNPKESFRNSDKLVGNTVEIDPTNLFEVTGAVPKHHAALLQQEIGTDWTNRGKKLFNRIPELGQAGSLAGPNSGNHHAYLKKVETHLWELLVKGRKAGNENDEGGRTTALTDVEKETIKQYLWEELLFHSNFVSKHQNVDYWTRLLLRLELH